MKQGGGWLNIRLKTEVKRTLIKIFGKTGVEEVEQSLLELLREESWKWEQDSLLIGVDAGDVRRTAVLFAYQA